MEQGAEKILAKHGCLYMKDDYKALFEELEAYYKPTEAVKNNAVLPLVSFSEERAEVCAHEFTPRQAWVHKCIKCGELHIEYKEQT